MDSLTLKSLVAATIVAALASCGGGGALPAATPTPAQAAFVGPGAVSAQEAAEDLMDIAEGRYGGYFPSHPSTQSSPPFAYRFYPTTGIYLGVVLTGGTPYKLGGVYVMGGPFGPLPVFVGMVSDFVNPVDLTTGGTDNGCYQLSAYDAPGRQSAITRSITQGTHVDTVSLETVVGGLVSTQGLSARQVETKVQYSSSGLIDDNLSYANHTGDGEVTLYSSLDVATETVSPGLVYTSVAGLAYSPPFVDRRYKLGIGQTVGQSYSITTTFNSTYAGPNAPPATAPNTMTRPVRELTTFVGRETITVPAGTFDTCKFEVVTMASAVFPTSVNTHWIAYGTGISVQDKYTLPGTLTADKITRATAVTLNGETL
jgi:hypothetical protein